MSGEVVRSTAEPVYSSHRDDPDYRDLLAEFAAAAPRQIEWLRDAFAADQLETLRVQAHQLKGSGGGYGFQELSNLAAELEVACQQPLTSPDRIVPLLDRVTDYLSRVRA